MSQVWRGFNMPSGALQMHATAYGARKAAWANAVKLIGEAADRIEARCGWASRGRCSKKMAEINRVHVLQYYCGSSEHLKDFAGGMHAFAQEYSYVPLAASLADWCAYVAEGDVENTVLYGAIALVDVFTAGSGSGLKALGAFGVKAGSKVFLGAGAKEAAKDAKKALSTKPGGGGLVTNTIIKGRYTIEFKHGDRHAIEQGIDPSKLDEAAARAIGRFGEDELARAKQLYVTVDGKEFAFEPYCLGDGRISVGTYRYMG